MNTTQTQTRTGAFPAWANEDLTDLAPRILTPVYANDRMEVALPATATTAIPYLLIDGNEAGQEVTCQPLTSETNARVELAGSCLPGQTLVLADSAVAADKGKVRNLPTDPGSYVQVWIAEDSGTDGDFILLRPFKFG